MAKRATITSSHLDAMMARKPATEPSGNHDAKVPSPAAADTKPADGRRAQTLRLNDAAWRQLKILAIDQRKTMHDLVVEGINLVFEKHGQPPVA